MNTPLFNVGDRVLYHGRVRGSLTGLRKAGDIATVRDIGNGQAYRAGSGKDSWTHLTFEDGQSWAVYDSDFELLGPAEPEEYEAWFVA